jgi:hypothetical protein
MHAQEFAAYAHTLHQAKVDRASPANPAATVNSAAENAVLLNQRVNDFLSCNGHLTYGTERVAVTHDDGLLRGVIDHPDWVSTCLHDLNLLAHCAAPHDHAAI